MRAQLQNLLAADYIERDAMAIPASVKGRLRYSSVVATQPGAIGAVLRDSWYGKQDERPVLFLDEEAKIDIDSPDLKDGYANVGHIKEEVAEAGADSYRSRYYSAYFWVMFLILRETEPGSGTWEIAYPTSDQMKKLNLPANALWTASIPFFEHGNMADAASCEFAKHQLTEKALSGLAFMVEQWEEATKEAFPWRFAYASAIDDANCGQPLAISSLVDPLAEDHRYPPLQGGETLRSMMERRLLAKADIADSRTGALHRRGLIDFAFHAPHSVRADGSAPAVHAACKLSSDVKEHYASLDQLRIQREA
jgi:hypothetical protein